MKKLLFALSMSAMCLFALPANAAETANTNDKKILFENLGFNLPEKTEDAEFITRGEFIYTLTQFVGSELYPNGTLSFEDVSNENSIAGALTYAVQNGIVSNGDKFYPDNEVTYNEAFKMSVAFIGRNLEAERAGGYPAGYTAVASANDMTKGLKDISEGKLTVRDFYTLLENIGKAEIMIYDYNNGLKNGGTVFEEYFDMYEIDGIITADKYTSLYDADANVNEGCIRIEDEIYYYNGDYEIGKSVEGWARAVDGDLPQLLSITEDENETITINLDDMTNSEGTTLYYEEDTREKKIKTVGSPAIIYNGKADGKLSLSAIAGMERGYADFIDNNADGKYDVILVQEYYVMFTAAVNPYDKIIIDKNGVTPLNFGNNTTDYYIYNQNQKIELEDLKKDTLIMVYESNDGELVKIIVSNETAVGVLNSYSDEYLKIDGVEYKYSDYFKKAYKSKLVIGEELEVVLSSDGIIQAIPNSQTTAVQYGYIIKMWIEDGSEDDIGIKLFSEDGELYRLALAKKVKFNNANKNAIYVYDTISTKRQLVRYKLNEAGELAMIDTQDAYGRLKDSADPYNCMTKYQFPSSVATTLWYIKENATFHPYFRIAPTTKIFIVAEGDGIEDEKRCAIKTASYFDNNQGQKSALLNAYDVSETGVCGALVVVDNTAINPTVTGSSPGAVAYKVSQAVTPEGETAYEVILYSGGQYKTYYTSSTLTETFADSNGRTIIEKGDAITYELTNDGYLAAVACNYDMSEKKMNFTNDNMTGTHTGKGAYYYGTVYDYDGENITIIPEGVTGVNASVSDETSRFSFILRGSIYAVERDCKVINETDSSEIITYKQSPEACTKIFIRTDDGQMQYAVIYK